MKTDINILMDCMLFKGVRPSDAEKFLRCFNYEILHFKKNEIIFNEGDFNTKIYILLSGVINLFRVDFWGNCNIVENIFSSQLFGVAFVCSKQKLSLSAIADKECFVLAFEGKNILKMCNKACHFHSVIISNLFEILSQKNILLNEKIQCLSERTTKEKIMKYLSFYAQKTGKQEFDIPFDRQQLANYLGVERSALSVEIGKLRKEKIVESYKNHFKLLKNIQ